MFSELEVVSLIANAVLSWIAFSVLSRHKRDRSAMGSLLLAIANREVSVEVDKDSHVIDIKELKHD